MDYSIRFTDEAADVVEFSVASPDVGDKGIVCISIPTVDTDVCVNVPLEVLKNIVIQLEDMACVLDTEEGEEK